MRMFTKLFNKKETPESAEQKTEVIETNEEIKPSTINEEGELVSDEEVDNAEDQAMTEMELVQEIKNSNEQTMKLNSLINEYVLKLEELMSKVKEQEEVIQKKDEEISQVKAELQNVEKDNEEKIGMTAAKLVSQNSIPVNALPALPANEPGSIAEKLQSLKGEARKQYFKANKSKLIKEAFGTK